MAGALSVGSVIACAWCLHRGSDCHRGQLADLCLGGRRRANRANQPRLLHQPAPERRPWHHRVSGAAQTSPMALGQPGWGWCRLSHDRARRVPLDCAIACGHLWDLRIDEENRASIPSRVLRWKPASSSSLLSRFWSPESRWRGVFLHRVRAQSADARFGTSHDGASTAFCCGCQKDSLVGCRDASGPSARRCSFSLACCCITSHLLECNWLDSAWCGERWSCLLSKRMQHVAGLNWVLLMSHSQGEDTFHLCRVVS